MLPLTYDGKGGRSSASIVQYAHARRTQIGGTGNGPRNTQAGVDITTKVYPTDIIPDKKIQDMGNQKGVFRQNNFLNDPYISKQLGLGAGGEMGRFMNVNSDQTNKNTQEDDELEVELTEEEFHYAVKMTDVAIRQLTK